MQLGLLEQVYDIYIVTNYTTLCKCLCNSVHCVKIYFLLYAHKSKMDGMRNERKWVGMHGNKKNLIYIHYFLHKYRVSLTVM
jgi:hypothetical protein